MTTVKGKLFSSRETPITVDKSKLYDGVLTDLIIPDENKEAIRTFYSFGKGLVSKQDAIHKARLAILHLGGQTISARDLGRCELIAEKGNDPLNRMNFTRRVFLEYAFWVWVCQEILTLPSDLQDELAECLLIYGTLEKMCEGMVDTIDEPIVGSDIAEQELASFHVDNQSAFMRNLAEVIKLYFQEICTYTGLTAFKKMKLLIDSYLTLVRNVVWRGLSSVTPKLCKSLIQYELPQVEDCNAHENVPEICQIVQFALKEIPDVFFRSLKSNIKLDLVQFLMESWVKPTDRSDPLDVLELKNMMLPFETSSIQRGERIIIDRTQTENKLLPSALNIAEDKWPKFCSFEGNFSANKILLMDCVDIDNRKSMLMQGEIKPLDFEDSEGGNFAVSLRVFKLIDQIIMLRNNDITTEAALRLIHNPDEYLHKDFKKKDEPRLLRLITDQEIPMVFSKMDDHSCKECEKSPKGDQKETSDI